jgi:hypothetical protein
MRCSRAQDKAATEGGTVSLFSDLIYLIMSFLIATLQDVYHSRNYVVKRQTLGTEQLSVNPPPRSDVIAVYDSRCFGLITE